MNSTLEKFGYPHTLIHDYDHWSVLLRPQQVTLGSLILAAHGQATAFGQLDKAAMLELSEIISAIEITLQKNLHCDKFNYLMLMMVDPHVHFHVFPRYENECYFMNQAFNDEDWPKPPDLSRSCMQNAAMSSDLQLFLSKHWENG